MIKSKTLFKVGSGVAALATAFAFSSLPALADGHRKAAIEVVTHAGAGGAGGMVVQTGRSITVPSSEKAKSRINEALDAFEVKWRFATMRNYTEAARVGFSSASNIMGAAPEMDPMEFAYRYQNDAMLYLRDTRGMVGTLRQNLVMILEAATLAQRDRADKVSPDDSPDYVIQQIDGEFRAQSNRIENWSGKLVALSYLVLSSAMKSKVVIDVNGKPVMWKYKWVAQPGKNCGTCVNENAQPWRNIEDMTLVPASETQCGARCRCVLVFSKESEIVESE